MQNRILGNREEKKNPIQSGFENPLYTVMFKTWGLKHAY